MAVKKSSEHSKGKHHEHNLKALTSFMVLAIGFGVFFLFYQNQENLTDPSIVKQFILLVIVLSAFLFGLLYLLNPKK